MIDLNKIVNDTLVKLEKEQFVETVVKKRLEKTITEIVDDTFREWSDFGKNLKEYIRENLNVNLESLGLEGYNSLALAAIKEELDKCITIQGIEKIKETTKEILSDVKPEYTLSEIIECLKGASLKEEYEYEEGDLIAATRNFSMAELLEMEFEEVKETKNPYKQVEHGDRYYSIFGFSLNSNTDTNHGIDNKLFSAANYFNNKEYAEYIYFKETLMRKLDRFAWEHNAKAVNWDDGSEKYFITFSNRHNVLTVDWACMYKSNDIYFTSRDIAEKALKKFKDDLMKLHTWKFDF